MSARAWLHDIRRRRWWQWTEIAIVVSIAVLSGLLIRPDDPFFVRSPFQWLWIAPVLLALRYGTTGGIASMILLLVAWHALRGQIPRGYEIFPKEFFLGGGILALVCGEFSDVWRGRVRRERKLNGYMDDRLEQLTRAHYMLRLSHERLEQVMVSRPATLRDGMARLRDLVARSQDPLSPQAFQEFLQLVNQYCPMEVASIHPTDGRAVFPETIASLGNPAPPPAGDGLIDYCLREGELAHVPIDGVGAVESRYLVAAPWRTRSGQWLGILLVEEMAFFAFHRESLQWLAVLLAYYADHVETMRDGRPMRAVLADCPVEFAQEIVKLTRIQRETGVRTSLVALTPGSRPDRLQLLRAIQRTQRGLDLAWCMEGGGDPVLLVLMPLSDAAAVEGYVARVEGILRDRFRLPAAEAFLHHASCTLDDEDPAVTVSDLVSRLRVSYHAAAAA